MAICPNTPAGGEHVVVRCSGCGSRHHTKNIGGHDPETHEVWLERSLFDLDQCECLDPKQFTLVHVCGIDCDHGTINQEARDAIRAKHELLAKANMMRISATVGFEVSDFVIEVAHKFAFAYPEDFFKTLIDGSAPAEYIARIREMQDNFIARAAEKLREELK